MAKFEKYEQGTPSWIEHSSTDQQASKEFYGRALRLGVRRQPDDR